MGSDYELIAEMATKLGIDHSIMPIKSVCMANATEEEPEYVFDPFFPRKQVTDLSGPENAGKTRFLIAFVSWLSRGMNPQGGGHEPVSVLLVTSEDSEGALLGPLNEYGGKLENFHVIKECAPLTGGVMSSIAAEARRLGVDMVVFDPIMEYLPPGLASNEFSQPLVQQFMRDEKRKIAVAANCAVVNIRHFSKASEKSTEKGGAAHGQKGGGSRAWTTKARSGLEFERPPFEGGGEAYAVIRHTRGNINRGHGGRFVFWPYRYNKPFDFETDPLKMPSQWDQAIIEYIEQHGGECLWGALLGHMEYNGLQKEQFNTITRSMVNRKVIDMGKQGPEGKFWVWTIRGGE